jgi:Leucine-rich repeat (LRR) protein
VQGLVDYAEDNRKTVLELDLSGIGAVKFTSRVFDLTKLTKLNMSNNKLRKISVFIKFLTQ